MKINKIISVCIFLLAILTLGAVSASQDINETVDAIDDNINIENTDINENSASEDILAIEENQKLDEGRKYAHDELYSDFDFDKKFSGEYFWHLYDDKDNPRYSVDFESDGLMNGVMNLYFDGDKISSCEFKEGKIQHYLYYDYEFHGGVGVHTWRLEYFGDDYYDNFVRNGTYEIIWAKIPKIIEPGKGVHELINLKLWDSSKPAVLEIKNGNDSIIKQSDHGSPIFLSDLNPGVYNYTLTHPDHHSYNGTFTVLLGMFIEPVYSVYAFGEKACPLSDLFDFNVTFSDNVNGNLTVEYNNTTYTFNVENGKSVISVENKILGYNYLVATFNGNAEYGQISREKRIYTMLYADMPEYAEVGSNIFVRMDLPSDANGVLKVSSSFKNRNNKFGEVFVGNFTVENGHAEFPINGLDIGRHEIHVTYVGDDKYKGTYTGIVQIHPPVDVPQSMIIGQNESVTIHVPESMGGTLTVYDCFTPEFDDYEYAVKIGKCDVVNNIASVSLSGLDVRNHTLEVFYESGGYRFTRYYPVCVKDNPQLELEVSDIYESETLYAGISANANVTGSMTLYLNGESYQVNPIGGKFTLEIDNLTEGKYNATLRYAGDDVFGPQEITKSFNVYQSMQPAIVAKNTNLVYSSNGKYSVTVYGRDGNPAGGVDIVFKISGKQVGKTKTNTNGFASYVVKNDPGTYKITAVALGVSATKTLTVKHVVTLKSVTVKKSAKKLVLQANLAKVNGKYLKGKNVVFKFNGKTYKTKTNSKGIARVTVKSSVLKKLNVGKKVTYQATYLKDTVKKTVKIKK